MNELNAIVTGANGALGRAVINLFLKKKIRVIAIDTQFGDIALFKNERCETRLLDLTVRGEIESFFNELKCRKINVHILVNNAAIPSGRRLHEIESEEWDRVMSVNLNAVFMLTKLIIALMLDHKYGTIVNISSIDGLARSNNIAYATSKAALIRFTETVAKSYGKSNIRANCVAPGFFESSMVTKYYSEELLKSLIKQIPLRRIASADEIANIVYFLASKQSSYITGSTIVADGGYLI